MHDGRVRLEDHLQAVRLEPKAVIHLLVVRRREASVEPALPEEQRARSQQKGRRAVVNLATMAIRRVERSSAAAVSLGMAVPPHETAGLLQRTVEQDETAADGTGAWRDMDNGAPIDPSGVLPDGSKFNGASGLREALLKNHREEFISTFTEKLMTYALGRGLTASDMPVVRSIVGTAARHNYSFSSVVLAIVNSKPFQG